ncbi:ROK family protein [Clavibacter tessellarius]|uniref:ROK family protein n=1 Tax=Clavibacter tessellarius TaxID=31965 RepID=UPI00324E4E07
MVALDLSNGRRFVGAVMNLRGEVLAESSLEVDGATGDAAVARVVRLAERLVAQTSRRLLGIAVGVPGIVDDAGVVRKALDLEWTDVPLRDRLADHFRVPVRIANDANLSAVGMHMFAEVPGQSVMVVTIEDGVGVGLVIGGALVEGEQFSAGEIGHVTVGSPTSASPARAGDPAAWRRSSAPGTSRAASTASTRTPATPCCATPDARSARSSPP